MPSVIVDEAVAARIERLASSAASRDPALADRLLGELGRARIVPARKLPRNVVTIGNAVAYRDETTGEERTVTLVYPGDADIAQQRVSVMTPIGAALIGLAEGASFDWRTRNGELRRLTVTRVGTLGDPAE